jgi:ubiquinone/menaquinone biosynthesis C-methylase UbiE
MAFGSQLWTLRRRNTMNTTSLIRRDWDERARKNAFHYIASWQKSWDLDSFLASGEEDYDRLVAPVLERCGISSCDRVMVELGCGAGRMTRSFARHYKFVIALDLSSEMLARARQVHATYDNILWMQIGGADLACLGNHSVDFVFSYLVLQHLPSEELVVAYIKELMRVLKPTGGFLFQFNGSHAPTMNVRGRVAWGLVDALWSANLVRLSHIMASLMGLDPSAAGKSWRGASLDAGIVKDVVHSFGGQIREMRGEKTAMAWCCGVKVEEST